MNQQIVDYLQKNKEAYTTESLVQQLRNVGYAENDIQEAVGVVYGADLSPNVIPMPNAPSPQAYATASNTSPKKIILMLIIVVIFFATALVGIFFMMNKKNSNVSDNTQASSTIKNSSVAKGKNTEKTQADKTDKDNKKSICYANATDIDISKYDQFEMKDEALTMIGVDYANVGNYEKAAICLEEAIESAIKRSKTSEVSKAYIDDIRLKLSVVYIQLGKDDKAGVLLEEITNHKFK